MGTQRPACLPPRSCRKVGGRRSAPNASKRAKLGPARRGWGIRCRSQSAAQPRIPISHPLCRPPSLLPVRANRRRCGAAVAHLSCVIVSPSVPPSPALPAPFALPSQIHNVFRCTLLSFPRKITYLPNYTLLATLGRRRRRGINERIIGYRG